MPSHSTTSSARGLSEFGRVAANEDGAMNDRLDMDEFDVHVPGGTTTEASNHNNLDISELKSTHSLGSVTGEDFTSTDNASSKFIVKRLKELYHDHVLEAEKQYHLHFNFRLPTDGPIKDSEFDAAPMVLLIGQYSTGKTTFLNHLLGEDFPGMHIGPEPTTDKFMALFHDGSDDPESKTINSGFHKRRKTDEDSARSIITDDIRASGRLIKGNTLTVTPNLPFSSLSQFGSAFLNHFVGSSSSSPLLKHITFIDTPGVLSGEKQRINRTYDFGKVAKWFADRSDLILLLFDAHKLDISDEFKGVIDIIRLYNDDKIRCVLNKADCVTREQLVRVYGSLMWSMGKIFHSPEVVRVYTGSYWNGSLINDDFERMFQKDEKLLVRELVDLPRCSAERKVNQMVNRIRLVKVHICILGTLSKMTPRFFGKKASREKILSDLDLIMDNVRVEFDLSLGDMPCPEGFAECLMNFADFGVFPPINKALIRRLDSLIEADIPEIVNAADNVTREVRLDKDKVLEEPEKVIETDPIASTIDESIEAEKSKSGPGLFGSFWNVVVVCLFLFSVIEGIYYWSFSKPAYSLVEFRNGYQQILQTAAGLVGEDATTVGGNSETTATVAFAKNFAPSPASINNDNAINADRKANDNAIGNGKEDNSNQEEGTNNNNIDNYIYITGSDVKEDNSNTSNNRDEDSSSKTSNKDDKMTAAAPKATGEVQDAVMDGSDTPSGDATTKTVAAGTEKESDEKEVEDMSTTTETEQELSQMNMEQQGGEL